MSTSHCYHLFCALLTGFLFASHLPERLAPGRFDYIGESRLGLAWEGMGGGLGPGGQVPRAQRVQAEPCISDNRKTSSKYTRGCLHSSSLLPITLGISFLTSSFRA